MGYNLTVDEEAKLVLSARSGDEIAQKRLTDGFYPVLKNHFSLKARGPAFLLEDCEDIATHSLLKGIKGFDPIQHTRFLTYCIRIGTNYAISIYRTYKKRVAKKDKVVASCRRDFYVDPASVFNEADIDEAYRIWEKTRENIIASAKNPQATEKNLSLFEDIAFRGISYSLAALLHDAPLGTIKSRVSQMRCLVAMHIKDHHLFQMHQARKRIPSRSGVIRSMTNMHHCR